jgi:hypothetical protein
MLGDRGKQRPLLSEHPRSILQAHIGAPPQEGRARLPLCLLVAHFSDRSGGRARPARGWARQVG